MRLDLVEWFCLAVVAFILAIVGFVCWSVYADSQRPTFELKREDWVCSKSEQSPRLQPMPVGKTLMLLPMPQTVCTEYRRAP